MDDTPYGGGPGMILKPEPLHRALEHIFEEWQNQSASKIVFPTPQGQIFSQQIAERLSQANHLVFICGHYKAIDQRVIDAWVTDEISVGDYILSGGEIPALLFIEGIIRLRPGVLGDIDSANDKYVLLLEDCAKYSQPDIELKGINYEQAKAITLAIAEFHARWWDDVKLSTYSFLEQPNENRTKLIISGCI